MKSKNLKLKENDNLIINSIKKKNNQNNNLIRLKSPLSDSKIKKKKNIILIKNEKSDLEIRFELRENLKKRYEEIQNLFEEKNKEKIKLLTNFEENLIKFKLQKEIEIFNLQNEKLISKNLILNQELNDLENQYLNEKNKNEEILKNKLIFEEKIENNNLNQINELIINNSKNESNNRQKLLFNNNNNNLPNELNRKPYRININPQIIYKKK